MAVVGIIVALETVALLRFGSSGMEGSERSTADPAADRALVSSVRAPPHTGR